jgi:C4-dicarboxylate-specific signal transduction histidine kinase
MDVTERKRAEEALRQAQAELAHAARVMTMGEMATSIAHEVNQPLSGVVINATATLGWLGADPPELEEAREAIRRIIRDGKRANEVLARVRALSRKGTTEKEWLDLNTAVQEVVGLAQGEINRTRVTLQTAFAVDLPRVFGDRVQLQQVVLNLILNGIEAMSGVVDRRRELTISTHREDPDRVRVVVKDSGIGLDPEKANQIFDAFYTTKRSGMGMGLSISRSIVENHGGRLWAVPNADHGTTFQFTV